RVLLQGLSPRVQDAQEADVRSQILGVGGNFKQRLRARLEEKPEKDPLVLPDQRDQCVGHAQHQMVIISRQQFSLASRQPFVTGAGLALRAVTVATGVVGDGLISARRTLIAMTAERRRPAAQDGIEYLHLGPRQGLTRWRLAIWASALRM